MTNRGRSALFCPYNLTQSIWSQWSIVTTQGPITGLAVDALTVPPDLRFQSLGANVDAPVIDRPALPEIDPSLPYLGNEPPFLHINGRAYLTTATFSDIKRLRTRKVGDWCSGLCVYHNDGSVEALGRWDPSDDKVILDIYDRRRDGPLTALTFRYATHDMDQSRITDIVVGDFPEVNRTYVWREVDDHPHVAWWLTQLCDHVTPWAGQPLPFRPAWKIGGAVTLVTNPRFVQGDLNEEPSG